MAAAPLFPAGAFNPLAPLTAEGRRACIGEIGTAPERMREAIDRVGEDRLDVVYRDWSARQIVLHLTESHLHSYIRFKWALTEDHPTIKAYDEGAWSSLPHASVADVQAALSLLDALHRIWHELLCGLSRTDLDRLFHHPESDGDVALSDALQYYAWHGKHHTAQVQWIADNR